MLEIGSGNQENKMELWSKKLSVIPFGGVFVALSEGRWIKDRSKLWNVVLEKTKSRELKYKQMRRAVLGSWRSRGIVIRKSNLWELDRILNANGCKMGILPHLICNLQMCFLLIAGLVTILTKHDIQKKVACLNEQSCKPTCLCAVI